MTWGVPVWESMKNQAPFISSVVNLDFGSLYGDGGYNLSNIYSDTVFNFYIKPLAEKHFELDVGIGYHLYDYFTKFFENDFLFKSNLSYVYKDIIRLQLNLGCFGKVTIFKEKSLNNVSYFSAIFGIDFLWNINKYLKLYLGANTIDYFDYSLIGTPYFDLGLEYKADEKLAIGMGYKIKMIDMIAVAENISEMLLSFYMKVSL